MPPAEPISLAVHDGLPSGISPADNETEWQMALAKRAALVETITLSG